jgi:hypothetical protein
VQNFSFRSFSPWRTLFSQFNRSHLVKKSVGSALFATGLLMIVSAMTQAAIAPIVLLQAQASPAVMQSQSMADGVYLYGQSPNPEQIGSAYMVFQVNNSQVVGAFYMPYSSFDCFNGDLQTNQLALTVVSSEEQAAYPYAVALQPGSNIASANGAIAPLRLEGYHRISTLSRNDRRLLAACQADHQAGHPRVQEQDPRGQN